MGTAITTSQPSKALSIAEGELQRLSAKLVPATEAEALSALKFMWRVLPMSPFDDDDDDGPSVLRQAYLIACQSQPRWAIVQARDAFIRGTVATHTSSFCPNPADFGREVSRIVDKDRLAASRARQEAEEARKWGDSDGSNEPMSEATRKRINAFLAQSKTVSAEMSASLRREPEPKAPSVNYAARVAAETAARRQAREGTE